MIGVIVAGGKQTRMKGVNSDIPKCLYKFHGKTNLYRNMAFIHKQGIKELYVISGSSNHTAIKEEIDSWGKTGIKVQVICDETGLGSGGCLSLLPNHSGEKYLIILGDIYIKDYFTVKEEKHTTVYVSDSGDIKDSDFAIGRMDHKKKTPIGVFTYPNSKIPNEDEELDLMRDMIGDNYFGYEYLVVPIRLFTMDYGTPERYKKLLQLISEGSV